VKVLSGIIGWIVGKIKWLLILAAIGGPVLAYFGWEDAQRRQDIAKRGVEATATVAGATKTTRKRGGVSYTVNLQWKDANGKDRSAEKISISSDYARQIIRNDRLTIAETRVKYVPDATDDKSGVMIVADTGKQDDLDEGMIYAGAGIGAIGIVGSALFFFLGRRREEEATA
jgi:hypothetical protein